MIFQLQLAFLIVPLELAQLVLAERRIGVRQIRAGIDPREAHPPANYIGWIWLALVAAIQSYPIVLVCEGETRLFGLIMLLFGVVGYDLRRRGGIRWALVVLTVEGALRIGVIINMFVMNFLYGSPYPAGLPRFWG